MDQSTARYVEMTKRIPSLTREEERSLIDRITNSGDRRATERLVEAHLRDVVFIARRHRFYGIPLADLIAEGNFGLMRALGKFDPAFNVRFGTYAAHWIRAFVVTHVLRSWSVSAGANGAIPSNLFFRLRRERARLESLHGPGEDTIKLLAERMDMDEHELRRALERLDARDVSLDVPRRAGSRVSVGEELTSGDSAERTYEIESLRHRVAAALPAALFCLDARERFIAEARWLADPDDELSLAAIARQMGVTRERVRQLECRAREKVRRALVEQHGVDADSFRATAA
jgi:RNA polymerase sigma-32 factor